MMSTATTQRAVAGPLRRAGSPVVNAIGTARASADAGLAWRRRVGAAFLTISPKRIIDRRARRGDSRTIETITVARRRAGAITAPASATPRVGAVGAGRADPRGRRLLRHVLRGDGDAEATGAPTSQGTGRRRAAAAEERGGRRTRGDAVGPRSRARVVSKPELPVGLSQGHRLRQDPRAGQGGQEPRARGGLRAPPGIRAAGRGRGEGEHREEFEAPPGRRFIRRMITRI